MKKYLILCFVILLALFVGFISLKSNVFIDKENDIYVIALDDASTDEAKNIYKSIKEEKKSAVLSRDIVGGNYNFYIASSYKELPHNINKNAINILYIPYFSNKDSAKILSNFDVVVVKSAKSFGHLKAINVRTAYIPNAFDINKNKEDTVSSKIAYVGNDEDFSLALYLIKNAKINIDVIGKIKNKNWDEDKIKSKSLKNSDEYALILIDQPEEDIAREIVCDRLLKLVSDGHLPFVRFNQGIYSMFGDAIPMYYNEEHFKFELNRLINSSNELKARRDSIRKISESWSAGMRAKKIIELFDIMRKKRI
jgi:hypothetical protein